MKLTLPYPISANRYWLSFWAPKLRRVITGPTREAKSYKQEVGWRAKAAGFLEPTTRPIEIASIQLCPRQNKDGSASATVLDLGNCWKVVEDALQGVVYVNDRQIKRIRLMEYGPPVEGGALIVDIREFQAEPTPIELAAEALQPAAALVGEVL